MSFLKNIFAGSIDAMKPVPKMPVPEALPGITASSAAAIGKAASLGDGAMALITPEQTPAQGLAALGEKQMGDDMVKVLAHGMDDRKGVFWATRSAEKVAGTLPPADREALAAAQAWVKNPTPEAQALAAKAAARTDFRGPGAWAAQGAAWAEPAKAAEISGAPVAMPRLTPNAVIGAVMLSAAVTAFPQHANPAAPSAPAAPTLPAATSPPPAPADGAAVAFVPVEIPKRVATQTFRAQQPFIADGLEIASGKVSPG
jgi:hypothetical protein